MIGKKARKMNYQEALELATYAHKGQKRVKTNEEYITHPIAIANKFEDEEYKIVSILHDVVEDTELTLDDLNKYGLQEDLLYMVDLLTHKENQTYLDYLLCLDFEPMAKFIKIEDLKHNLINPLSKCQEDKHKMALYILEDLNDS